MDDAAPSLPFLGEVIGGNRPPEPIGDFVTSDVAVLQARLERDYRATVARFVELELGAKKVPARITNDQDASTTVDWVGQQCKVLIAQAERDHAKEKKPYLLPGRVVDRFFLDRIRRLTNVIGPIERRVQLYYDAKKAEVRRQEDAARRRAQETAIKAAAEAERLAAEARASEAAGDRRTAIELTQMAEREETTAALAAAQAGAPPAPVAIRGDYGSTGFSVERWTFEVLDPAAIPLGYLTIDEKAVKEAIDEGVREIAGLRIYQADRFTIKRC
jgi:hypothetical protein